MIGQNINQLINIAESQSDERLAQELNPQTETGMLGPTWLPASELSFRQKIRAEAQAQPQNNPPIVQQLAQSVMPPMMPQQQMMPPPQQMMPQQPMMPPQQQMPMAPAGMSAQPQMPTQMFASGGSVKDVLLPDFSSIETLMQGLGGGVGVSDEGTAKWWNPVAGLPHVQYANLQATGEPMIGLPLGNIGNITQDVSEWAGVYKPPFEQWDQETIDKYLAKQKEENNMSGGGLLENMSGIGVMKNAMEGDMSMMGFLPLLYNQFKGDKDEEEEEAIPMSAGGLVRYAHGGRTEGATKAEQSVLRSLWDKMTRGQKEEMMSKPSEDAHVPFNSYEEARRYKEFIDSPEWEQLVPGGSYEEPPRMSAGGLVNFANGGDVDPFEQQSESQRSWQLNRPFFPEGFSSPYAMLLRKQGFGLPPSGFGLRDLTEEQMREMATDAPIPEEFAPIRKDIATGLRGLAGYGTGEETETEIDALNILKQQGDALNQIQSKGGVTGYLTRDNPDYERMTEAEDFYEGLMGSPFKLLGEAENIPTGVSPIQARDETDALTMSRYFANNPEDYKLLTDLQEEHGDLEGLLRFAEDKQTPVEEIEVTAEKRPVPVKTVMGPPSPADDAATAASFVGPPKPKDLDKPQGDDAVRLGGKNIQGKPSNLRSQTTGTSLPFDILKGQEMELGDELDNQLKALLNQDGQMNRKWLAIAAGAFNAAEKGAPTLMAGLADLGGGVSDELQKLDKEDQERAIALFEIYYKKKQLEENKRAHDLTYNAAMYGHQMDYSAAMAKEVSALSKAGITDRNDQIKYLLDSGKDYAAVMQSVEEGKLAEEYKYNNDIIHANIGNPNARISYNNHMAKLEAAEAEIIATVEEEIGVDYDKTVPEHKNRAEALYAEFFEENPGLDDIRKDYYSGRNQSDWVVGKLIL